MIFRKKNDSNGDYIDSSGVRFNVLCGMGVFTDSRRLAQWKSFDTLQEALEDFGLVYEPIQMENEEYTE